ncbi:MAG: glycosyltransferase family 39 protein [Candidatus Thermoplasmatota archaeon]|nr:glycosyltransferase family 39 protein [Candidatus Thermoplasmatota archaeon]
MELQEIESIKKLRGWFSRNWEFAGVLLLFALYMFLSNFYMWGQTFLDGFGNFSGGSDPYFNYYIILRILATHASPLHTIGLNYPIGSGNPRPLFFHWMIVFVATITAPLFGGATTAAYYSFMEFDAVFGALLIIPVYLLGKSILGRKAGMIAAVLYTLMPSNLTSGILSDGRMHTPELIFAFFAIYFFERAVQSANKNRVIEGSLLKVTSYYESIVNYIRSNKKPTFYALFAGASYGALMLSWQGHAYILAIIAIYVVVQLLINLFLSRNTGYLLYITAIFVPLAFAMGYYYYFTAPNAPAIWFVPPLLIGVAVIFIAALIGIVGRKPWIIAIPVLVLTVGAFVGALYFISPHIYAEIVSGEGYFIKSRLYSTIAEAQAPALGQYIGGFGVAQFVVGIGGFMFVIYKFIKEKTDSLAFLIIFSGVSIYMSFTAARFNITASPAYAIMGGALLYYFADILKLANVKDDTRTKKAFRKRSGIKGDVSWLQAVMVLIVVFGILIPSGLGVMSAAVPVNSASSVNHQVYSSLPAFAKPPQYLANQSAYFGQTGSDITNSSSPLSQSMAWFAQQQANLSLEDKPAYVNWWDYGFQELYQGQHPTVADDFQQAYQVAGQILLSTNQSQIIALFSARLMQASLDNSSGKFSPGMQNVLSQYFNNSEINLLQNIYKNPVQYESWIRENSTIYGKFNSSISSANAYYALEKGQLASKLSLPDLVNLYQELQHVTGWSIQYIQVDHTLFPLSAVNTGTFYAPSYLTNTPTYTTSSGAIVPYNYYQIYAVTTNGTFPLNLTPPTASVTSYQLGYTPAFYNTTIYKTLIGLPPSAVGQTNGIPGLSYGSSRYTMEPAYNMSNFEICYEGVPYNPYTNYSSHLNNFTVKPLQKAYSLEHSGKGTAFIFPRLSSIIQSSDPIIRYFPGAVVEGQVKTPGGTPVPGARVTVYDQYNVPHSTVVTNKNGYYNITALPGNDTLIYSYGALNKQFLEGKSFLSSKQIFVSRAMAERKVYGINETTGLPNYYIQKNLITSSTSATGNVTLQTPTSTGAKNTPVNSGRITMENSSSNQKFAVNLVNGKYNFQNIPMGIYNVSVHTNGTTYNDVSIITIANGTNIAKNIVIQKNTLNVKVSLSGKVASGVTVNIGGRKFITNSTGQITAGVNSGSYLVSASFGDLISNVNKVTFQNLNTTKLVTLNLRRGVNATVTLTGPEANGNLSLLENGDLGAYQNLTNIGNNVFTGLVAPGYYTVYKNVSNYVVFNSFNINKTSSFTFQFTKGLNTSVINNNVNLSLYSGTIGIIAGQSILQFRASKLKNLTVELPSNSKYTFYETISKAGKNYYASTTSHITSTGLIALKPTNATIERIEVFNPGITGSFNSLSAVGSGAAIFNLSGNPFEAVNISGGYATIFTQNPSLSGFSLRVYSSGYTGMSDKLSQSVAVPLIVSSKEVTLNFHANQKAALLNGKLNVYGTSTATLQIINGTAKASLPSGSYVFTMTGGNMYALNYTNTFTVGMSNMSLNVSYTPKVTLSISNANTMDIYNKNGNLVTNPFMMSPGNYTVYSIAGNKAAIQEVTLSQNTTMAASLTQSYSLSILNSRIGNQSLKIMANGHILALPNMKNLLPAGQYYVNLTSHIVTGSGEFIYSGSKNIDLTTSTSLTLARNNYTFKTNVNGKLSASGNLVSGYFLNIYKNGTMVDQAVTKSNGSFSLHLFNGNYTYYVYSTDYSMAGTGVFSISPFEATDNLAIRATKANLISLNTYVSGNLKSLPVNITLNKELFRIGSNGNPILLPSENYAFSAYMSNSVTVNGYTTSYAYRNSQTVNTNESRVVNLFLSKILIGNITISQKEVSNTTEYHSVTYNLTFRNHLNSMENITLASGSSAWSMSFNKSVIHNLAINKTVSIKVTLTNKKLVPEGVNSVPIKISYNGGSLNDYVKVNLTKNLNFSIKELNTAPSYNNGSSILQYKVTNTGNTRENVNLSINSSLIQSLVTENWNVSLLYKGHAVSNITLNYSQSKVISIVFTPGSHPVSTFNIAVVANLTNTNETKYISIQYTSPNVPGVTVYSKGPGVISNYTGDPFATIEYGLIIIAIAVIGGISTVAIRGRKRK